MPESLSAEQARRIQLAAQGFGTRRPGEHGKRVTRTQFRGVLDRLGLVQLDSVNVIARAHELTFFARLGPYDREALGTWLHGSHEVFEYWGHAMSFLPVDLYPAMRHRMALIGAAIAKKQDAKMKKLRVDTIAAIREGGGVTAGELHEYIGEGPKRSGPWWGWTPPKQALEGLFWAGELAAVRTPRFERVYDLPERMLPPAALAAGPLPDAEGRRELVRRSVASLGVGTVRDLSNYFYQPGPLGSQGAQLTKDRPIVEAMVSDGELLPVDVEGWKEQGYVAPGTRVPGHVTPRTLVAPFDSLTFDRDRMARLFGFDYKLEIFTPAAKRVFGYYVMPFLLGESFVGRIDLKADRKAKQLLVHAAWAELGVDKEEVAMELADELRLMAGWLGLDDVVVAKKGTLASALTKALR